MPNAGRPWLASPRRSVYGVECVTRPALLGSGGTCASGLPGALPAAAAGNLVLTPDYDETAGTVSWVCDESTIPVKYLPAYCR